jgi:hypothetical protein
MARLMRQQFGRDNVILSDIIRPSREILDNGKLMLHNDLTKRRRNL